ncbi:hypothetical protein YPPY36_0561, partial [Yersinia pestis PY-36]
MPTPTSPTDVWGA